MGKYIMALDAGTTSNRCILFDQKGQIIIDKEECEMDADDLMMTA